MNTLLYLGQIVVGAVVVAAGLAGSVGRGGRSRSVRNYADAQVAGLNGVIGGLLGVAALVLGVVGLAGTEVVSMPVTFLITMAGLVSVVLTTEFSSPVHEVELEEFAVASEPAPGDVVALPGRDGAGSVARAA